MTSVDKQACFVATAAIRQAVSGHEEALLDALGIDWRAGRPHITCPYVDHPDQHPSWRWDERARRARCTCSNSDDIFDVIQKMEGLDFAAAKLRAAELLGRHDLIRATAGGGSDPRYQATDKASLLNAPAERRDDALPTAYLAHRLGVSVDAVPVPSTPFVGLKTLGYYDPPPAGSRAKPKLVGDFPCAVFGTLAADGGTHAHRIYLAPDGAGKADLGIGPDGQSRDPKKSVKRRGDENTAGRGVLWGNAAEAPCLIVTEGIETGAAVAFAVAPELAAGAVAVAAAISAGGIEAFQPYSGTTHVIIAADRDESPKADGRPGSKRGERAARTFALRHFEQIQVAVALPGVPGETADWLDVLRRDGVEAVRAGIQAAARYVPTDEERQELSRSHSRSAELQETAALYPLPVSESLPLVYRHSAGGKIMVHKVVEGPNSTSQYIPIATPFGVTARLRHVDQANAYGLRCLVQDMNGQPRAVDFERAALAKLAASEVRGKLFAAGLRTEADGEMVAVQCLKAADPGREVLVFRRPGWQEVPGLAYPVFLCPDGRVIGAPDGLDLELSAAERMPPEVAVAGQLEAWQHAIATAVSVPNCPHWVLGVVAAFAGPIIALTGVDTCGINLSGLTTSGKSTAQRLAASAWSTPDIRKPGLCQSARATDNAVEALANRAAGSVLCLDELAHVSGKTAAKMIYTIAGGVGKRRLSADAVMRESYTWATFAILSGETSLEEKVRSDGGEWSGGMAVRIVDFDVTDINRHVDAETLRTISSVEQNHGHAGPAFVRALTASGLHRQAAALRERVLKAARALSGGDGADSALVRAAAPLAVLLVAGELAKNVGLLPPLTAVREAVAWAWQRFRHSSDASALDPETQVIDAIRTWVGERWNVTIKNVAVETGINNREAVAWYDDGVVYLPKPRLREAAGNNLRESQVASILDRRGLLAKRTEADRLYVRFVPKVGRIVSYALRRSEFGRTHASVDLETLRVHPGSGHV